MASAVIKIKLGDLLNALSATAPKKGDLAAKRFPGAKAYEDAELRAVSEYILNGGINLDPHPLPFEGATLHRLNALREAGEVVRLW